jgi:26S proteasome regulatory subunit N8
MSNTNVQKLPHNLVVVHPLVLLSCVDHYNRVAQTAGMRVVGVLLGSISRGRVEVTNSYAGLVGTV